ncbi:MAG TPA: ATP-binding protein [Chloroflexota bacterium]|nr:ATP-binding protein [Chloroflexota bacterium]
MALSDVDTSQREPAAAEGSKLDLPGDPTAARLVAAREADRRALSRLLHDEAAQTLANVALHLQICERAIGVDVERGKGELQSARAALGDAMTRLRAQVFELRPQILEEAGVVATLRRYAQTLPQPEGVSVEVVDQLGGARPAPAVELGLYRVAQAAVANAVRHAEASKITVTVASSRGQASVEVRDDGHGFDAPSVLGAAGDGGGLALMRDWADALGADLSIESGAQGTLVRLQAPRS